MITCIGQPFFKGTWTKECLPILYIVPQAAPLSIGEFDWCSNIPESRKDIYLIQQRWLRKWLFWDKRFDPDSDIWDYKRVT